MRSHLIVSIVLSLHILLISLLIQTWIIDITPVKSSPEYITIDGNLFYWDHTNTRRPLVWARVWITDREPDGNDYILVEVFSDVNGYFNSGPIVNNDGPGEDGLDIGIYIVAWNWAVQVINQSGIRYYGFVGPFNDLPDGNYHFTIETPRGHGAWMIFSYHNGIGAGWNYLDTQTGYEAPMVTCRWPNDTWPHYHHGGEIHLPDWACWWPDIILHEYGHHVMYSLYGYIPPSMPEHWFSIRSNSTTAWAEGWADFFPLVVFNDPVFTWSNGTHYANINLETPHWCSSGWHDGDKIEGRVAGALWDIFDPYDDGYDTFSDGFSHIWHLLSTQTDNTFNEFWQAWVAHNESGTPGYPKQNALMSIFQNSIDYREPGDANADQTVDIYDLTIVYAAFGSTKGDSNWDQCADLDYNETIDIFDVVIVAANFGNSYDC